MLRICTIVSHKIQSSHLGCFGMISNDDSVENCLKPSFNSLISSKVVHQDKAAVKSAVCYGHGALRNSICPRPAGWPAQAGRTTELLTKEDERKL